MHVLQFYMVFAFQAIFKTVHSVYIQTLVKKEYFELRKILEFKRINLNIFFLFVCLDKDILYFAIEVCMFSYMYAFLFLHFNGVIENWWAVFTNAKKAQSVLHNICRNKNWNKISSFFRPYTKGTFYFLLQTEYLLDFCIRHWLANATNILIIQHRSVHTCNVFVYHIFI